MSDDPLIVVVPLASREKHTCPLPWTRGGYGSTGHPEGTIVGCRLCGQWWVCRPCYRTFGPVTVWRPVRRWHFRLRRQIIAAVGA